MAEDTAAKKQEILDLIHGLIQFHIDSGVDPNERFVCDCCGHERSLAGSFWYQSYHLCNGCTLEYELLHFDGKVRHVGEFILLRKIEG
ncbi:MAG: hypothetical protein ACUVXI_03335 [bacterium]